MSVSLRAVLNAIHYIVKCIKYFFNRRHIGHKQHTSTYTTYFHFQGRQEVKRQHMAAMRSLGATKHEVDTISWLDATVFLQKWIKPEQQ